MNDTVAATLFQQSKRLPIAHQAIEDAIKASEVVSGKSGKFFIVKKKGEQVPSAVKLSCEAGMLVEDGVKILHLSDVEFVAHP
jgi:hypothetical protein